MYCVTDPVFEHVLKPLFGGSPAPAVWNACLQGGEGQAAR